MWQDSRIETALQTEGKNTPKPQNPMILNENKWCKWLFVDCSIKCVPHFPDEIALDRRELHATRPPTSELAARPRRRILARCRVRDVAGCLDAVVVSGQADDGAPDDVGRVKSDCAE